MYMLFIKKINTDMKLYTTQGSTHIRKRKILKIAVYFLSISCFVFILNVCKLYIYVEASLQEASIDIVLSNIQKTVIFCLFNFKIFIVLHNILNLW